MVSKEWGFLKAVMQKDLGKIQSYHQKAPMSTLTGTEGGYLVPLDYSLIMMRGLAEKSIFLDRCTTIPMTSMETTFPKPKTNGTGASGTSPFFGGLSFTWNNVQGSSLNQDEPSLAEGKLFANDLLGEIFLSNQFMADIGPSGEKALTLLIGEAAAWHLDYAFINGTGSADNMPLGLINAPCAIEVTRASSGHVTSEDVATMSSKLLPFGWEESIWLVNASAIKDVTRIDNYMPNSNPLGLERGCIGYLYSRPVFATEKTPVLGTKGDLILFDPRCYVIGKRSDIYIEFSPHPRFRNNQTVARVWVRADGKPVFDSSVTLADGASTASCVIVLGG